MSKITAFRRGNVIFEALPTGEPDYEHHTTYPSINKAKLASRELQANSPGCVRVLPRGRYYEVRSWVGAGGYRNGK